MRIVLVTRRYWPLLGGAEKMMQLLAAGMQGAGHEVRLVTARWGSDVPARQMVGDLLIERLPQPSLRWWGTWRYLRQLDQWLRRHRDEYDLVYVSMLKHDAFQALATCRKLNRPVVLRAEGGGPTGDAHWQRTALGGTTIARACRSAAAIVCPSQGIVDELLGAGYQRARLRLIHNGVPIGPPQQRDKLRKRRALIEAHPTLGRLSPERPWIVYTGRLDRNKGLRELISAWSRLVPRCDGELVLAGAGQDEEMLRRVAEDAGVSGSVTFAGSFADVDDLLAAADLFVLPSYQEGLPLSLLEAMAAQVPVIATTIPGVEEIIQSADEGRLVPPRAIEPLTDAIASLLEDDVAAESMALRGRARIEEKFALLPNIEKHLSLFETLATPPTQNRTIP